MPKLSKIMVDLTTTWRQSAKLRWLNASMHLRPGHSAIRQLAILLCGLMINSVLVGLDEPHAPLVPHDSLDSAVSAHSQLKVSSGSDTDHSSGSERDVHDSSPLDEITILAAPKAAKPAHPVIKMPLANRSPRGLLATFRATPPQAGPSSPAKLTETASSASPVAPLRTTPVLTPSHSASNLVTLALGQRPSTPTADPEFIPSPRTLTHRLTHSHAATYEHLNVVLAQIQHRTYRRAEPGELETALEFAQAHRKLDAVLTILTYCRDTDYQIDEYIMARAQGFLQAQEQQQQRECAQYLQTKQLTVTSKLCAAIAPELIGIARELERRQTILAQISRLAGTTMPARTASPVSTATLALGDRHSSSEFGYLATDAPTSPITRPVTPFTADHAQRTQQHLTSTAAQLLASIKRDYGLER